jgi:hypothetical protein
LRSDNRLPPPDDPRAHNEVRVAPDGSHLNRILAEHRSHVDGDRERLRCGAEHNTAQRRDVGKFSTPADRDEFDVRC